MKRKALCVFLFGLVWFGFRLAQLCKILPRINHLLPPSVLENKVFNLNYRRIAHNSEPILKSLAIYNMGSILSLMKSQQQAIMTSPVHFGISKCFQSIQIDRQLTKQVLFVIPILEMEREKEGPQITQKFPWQLPVICFLSV